MVKKICVNCGKPYNSIGFHYNDILWEIMLRGQDLCTCSPKERKKKERS
jgi:hypothetical protein